MSGETRTATPSRREDWDWLAADLMAEVRRQEAGGEPFGTTFPNVGAILEARGMGPPFAEVVWLSIAASALRMAMAARKLRPGPHPWPRGGDAAPAVQPNRQG